MYKPTVDSLFDDLTSESEKQNNTKNEENLSTVVADGQPKQSDSIDYKDLFLRLSADFQNHQKRVERQKAEWLNVGEEAIILKILPILQDLERALNSAIIDEHENIELWVEGLRVINKNLSKVFADLNLQEVSTTGEFNPEIHEAIAQIESAKHTSGQIVNVVNKGYLFKGKVIKFAQVTVAK